MEIESQISERLEIEISNLKTKLSIADQIKPAQNSESVLI